MLPTYTIPYFFLSSKHPDMLTNVLEQMKHDLRTQPRETVKQSFRTLKQEIAKYGSEMREGLNIHKNMTEGIVLPGQRRREWGFQSVGTSRGRALTNQGQEAEVT